MVNFEAKLSDGSIFLGNNENGSWTTLPKYLKDNQLSINGLKIYNDQGTGVIDDDCDGYFFGNKVISTFPYGGEIHFIGIGYWKEGDPKVRIIWYNADTLEPAISEARPINECGFLLIKNNTDDINRLEKSTLQS